MSIRMIKIKKKNKPDLPVLSAGEDENSWKSYALLVRMESRGKWYSTPFGGVCLNMDLPHGSAIILQGIYPSERQTCAHTKTCMQMFIAALFILAPNWKQLTCPSTQRIYSMDKLWYIRDIPQQEEWIIDEHSKMTEVRPQRLNDTVVRNFQKDNTVRLENTSVVTSGWDGGKERLWRDSTWEFGGLVQMFSIWLWWWIHLPKSIDLQTTENFTACKFKYICINAHIYGLHLL